MPNELWEEHEVVQPPSIAQNHETAHNYLKIHSFCFWVQRFLKYWFLGIWITPTFKKGFSLHPIAIYQTSTESYYMKYILCRLYGNVFLSNI